MNNIKNDPVIMRRACSAIVVLITSRRSRVNYWSLRKSFIRYHFDSSSTSSSYNFWHNVWAYSIDKNDRWQSPIKRILVPYICFFYLLNLIFKKNNFELSLVYPSLENVQYSSTNNHKWKKKKCLFLCPTKKKIIEARVGLKKKRGLHGTIIRAYLRKYWVRVSTILRDS